MPRSASRRALASSRYASSRKNRTPCSTDRSSVCSRMPTMKRTRRMSASASCPSLIAVILPAEAGLDHHLLAVVRPAFDERRRREQDRLAHLRLDLAQVLVVEEVARVDLVDRDRPERRVVVVAQVLVLPLGRPRRIDVGQVVVGARRLASRTAPASTCWRTTSGRSRASARR